MGDRICLTFTDGDEEFSPTLYAHWDGMGLLDVARGFWEAYHDKIRDEPSNFMYNFIAFISRGKVEDGNYYLYPSEDESCSPDDNGFWMMNTTNGKIYRSKY
jgi:hypothetical protein